MIQDDQIILNCRRSVAVAFLNRFAANSQADVLITTETEFPPEMLIGVVGSAMPGTSH